MLTFLSLSLLSYSAADEQPYENLLKQWNKRLHQTGEVIISNEGNSITCVNIVGKMANLLNEDWWPALHRRNALLKKIGRPASKALLFNFERWSADFLEDPSSGTKHGVLEIFTALENLTETIKKLEVIAETLEEGDLT
ncbi:hypothetical protein OAN21_01970 [Alphaproteobacteria bacterium]|nr:hypothetical protein [Alphaproteobacteria bacterium]